MKFSLVLLQMTNITSLALEKMLKRMGYAFNIILVQGFCPLKIKITQFPGGFHLNSLGFVTHSYSSIIIH